MFGSSLNRPQVPDTPLTQPPPDSISKIAFAPVITQLGGGNDILAVASWDNAVRLYAVRNDGQSEPRAMYTHDKPVLDLAWHSDGTKLFSGGCDGHVKMFDLSTGQSSILHTHDKPVSCVEFVNAGGQEILVTGGWDRQLRPITQNGTPITLSERIYAMGFNNTMLVVGTADRKIYCFRWTDPFTPFRQLDSPLRWQTRVIRCFPQVDAFAIGSIEGRVGIHYPFHEEKSGVSSPNYSFKCHRYDFTQNSIAPGITNHATILPPGQGSSQNVFAINDICFHKEYETFATAGSDGSLSFWDGVVRSKLKGFTLKELNNGDQDAKPTQFGLPIVSTAFSANHSIFAYALSYDWSKGHSGVPPSNQTNMQPRVMLHQVKPDEVQKKKKL